VELIVALPDSNLADTCALAVEAGNRRLTAAVTTLVSLCKRFAGFGIDRMVPEQAAALAALAAIGGADASRFVCEMIVKRIFQGPTLEVAVIAASQLDVVFPADFALLLLRHSNPLVRASACTCVRKGPEIVPALIELLDDFDRNVSTAAACALGRMGRAAARNKLKQCLDERPSKSVIEAVAGVADHDAIVLLERLGRDRLEFADAILSVLDESDQMSAADAATRLRHWLSGADRRDSGSGGESASRDKA